MTVFWFRRDLRLEDNHGLFEALSSSESVLPIFIFDKTILDELPKDDARVTFIHESLTKINAELTKISKSLAVFYGEPKTIFNQLLSENKVDCVYTNHDYEPYAIKRDADINTFFKEKGVSFETFKDQVIFESNDVACFFVPVL